MLRKLCVSALVVAAAGHAVAQAETARFDIQMVEPNEALKAELLGELGDPGPAPVTRFEARRQARNAAVRLTEFLNSKGYLAGTITPGLSGEDGLVPSLTVDAGVEFKIASLQVALSDGSGADALVGELENSLSLAAGDTAIPSAVLGQEARLLAGLRSRGFAFAQTETRDVLGDRSAGTVEVTLRFSPGPLVRFGDVRFEDGLRTSARYLARLVPFDPGEVYEPEALAELEDRLRELQIYSIATASLDEQRRESVPPGPAEPGTATHDVIVTLAERARMTVAAGVSYSTSEGTGLTVSWTRRNALRRADTFDVSATIADLQRAGDINWRFPNLFGYGRSLALNSSLGQDETDAFDRDFLSIGGTFEVKQSPSLIYTLGVGSEFTRELDAFRRERGLVQERTLQILSASVGARLEHADDLLDPTRGWRASARLEPGLVQGDESTSYALTTGEVRTYLPVQGEGRLVWANRLKTGFAFGTETLTLPANRRFFAGGGGSVRGYAYQSIGPLDAAGAPLGGRGLLEGASELRWRARDKLGISVFADAGSVSSETYPTFDDMRYGAGLGVRYYTAIGPIRLDLAAPLNGTDDDEPVQIYVSLGQAF